jgi:hypothetical protein
MCSLKETCAGRSIAAAAGSAAAGSLGPDSCDELSHPAIMAANAQSAGILGFMDKKGYLRNTCPASGFFKL